MTLTVEELELVLAGVAVGAFGFWFLRCMIVRPARSAVGARALEDLRLRVGRGGVPADCILVRRDLMAALVADVDSAHGRTTARRLPPAQPRGRRCSKPPPTTPKPNFRPPGHGRRHV